MDFSEKSVLLKLRMEIRNHLWSPSFIPCGQQRLIIVCLSLIRSLVLFPADLQLFVHCLLFSSYGGHKSHTLPVNAVFPRLDGNTSYKMIARISAMFWLSNVDSSYLLLFICLSRVVSVWHRSLSSLLSHPLLEVALTLPSVCLWF